MNTTPELTTDQIRVGAPEHGRSQTVWPLQLLGEQKAGRVTAKPVGRRPAPNAPMAFYVEVEIRGLGAAGGPHLHGPFTGPDAMYRELRSVTNIPGRIDDIVAAVLGTDR